MPPNCFSFQNGFCFLLLCQHVLRVAQAQANLRSRGIPFGQTTQSTPARVPPAASAAARTLLPQAGGRRAAKEGAAQRGLRGVSARAPCRAQRRARRLGRLPSPFPAPSHTKEPPLERHVRRCHFGKRPCGGAGRRRGSHSSSRTPDGAPGAPPGQAGTGQRRRRRGTASHAGQLQVCPREGAAGAAGGRAAELRWARAGARFTSRSPLQGSRVSAPASSAPLRPRDRPPPPTPGGTRSGGAQVEPSKREKGGGGEKKGGGDRQAPGGGRRA